MKVDEDKTPARKSHLFEQMVPWFTHNNLLESSPTHILNVSV